MNKIDEALTLLLLSYSVSIGFKVRSVLQVTTSSVASMAQKGNGLLLPTSPPRSRGTTPNGKGDSSSIADYSGDIPQMERCV
jgi:hypothetical protein